MYYVYPNFKSKKAFKEAVAAGKPVDVVPTEPHESAVVNGKVAVGGPHYPQAHKWYASVVIANGKVVKVS